MASHQKDKVTKFLTATRKQIKPLEEELTSFRATFIALKAFDPGTFGPGGDLDLELILKMAKESAAVKKIMAERDQEIDAIAKMVLDSIDNQELNPNADVPPLKEPIGFKLPNT